MNNKNIKIAKQLIKLAKNIIDSNKIEQIIDTQLQNNPIKAINNISELLNDRDFDSLVKQVKISSFNKKNVIAFRNNLDVAKKELKEATKFTEKLKSFCQGKSSIVIASACALLYAYIHLNFMKQSWINDIAIGQQLSRGIELLSFLTTVSYFLTTPFVFKMITNLCKNLGYNSIQQAKNGDIE